MKINVNNNLKNKILFENNYQNILNLDLNEFKNENKKINSKSKNLNIIHTKYINKRERNNESNNNDNITSIFEKEKKPKCKNENKMDIEELNEDNNFISKENFLNINNFESEKKKNIELQKFQILNHHPNQKKFIFKKLNNLK